jgi:hypothetical protein
VSIPVVDPDDPCPELELDECVLGALECPAVVDGLELDELQPARTNPAATRASPATGRLDRLMRHLPDQP